MCVCVVIPQLDGQEETLEEESYHLVKTMIVSTSDKCAKQELNEYYIENLEPHHDGNLEYFENESGKLYKGGHSCYNEGDHQEYYFKFKTLNTSSRAEIQKTIQQDAVMDLVFLT